ncbi:MAG TPA: ComEA family DNA-binding protein [Thermoleophilaceae bacterium]
MFDQARASTAAWVVAAALAAFAALRFLHGGEAPAAPPVRVDGGTEGRAAPGVSRGVERAYVHVAGAVRRPGLYRVPQGSRVAAAIDRAGGPLPRADLAGVNLAARVEDGQQVVVPRRGAAAPGGAAGGAGAAGANAAAAPGVKVSLGSATAEQLDGLDGIGPTLAQRIVEYRQAHGGFSSIDQLGEVEGIGEKRLEALREAVQP